MSGKVKVGYIQTTCSQDKTENIAKALTHIEKLADKGAQVICLQELFTTRYFCYSENPDSFSLAEKIPGPDIDPFIDLARKKNIVLILSLFEKRTKGIYHNTAAVIDCDGTLCGIYRKSHIPDDPGYYEKFYFTPGDTGYKVFNTKYARIGVLICWDQWYPEAARITSLLGAEIIFFPTAIGWDMNEKNDLVNREQLNAWKTIQMSHAIANGIHVVSVNRCGIEEKTDFWGNSFICNPFGTILYESPKRTEDMPVVEIDLNSSEYYRNTWPFLRDRRIDNYNDILKRYIDF